VEKSTDLHGKQEGVSSRTQDLMIVGIVEYSYGVGGSILGDKKGVAESATPSSSW